MKLSKSLEDYMEAVYIAEKENGEVRLKDVAERVGVKLPSANQALNKLSEEGFLNYKKYEPIRLTKKGEKIAKKVYRKHKALFEFLTKILDVEEKKARREACSMEHFLSNETIDKLIKFTKNFDENNKEVRKHA